MPVDPTRATAAATTTSARIQERLGRLKSLPALSNVALKLNAVLDSQLASAREVEAVISADPAIATQLLRFANSAALGLRSPVTTVVHAITVIGLDGVRSAVLGRAIMRVFPGAELAPGLPFGEFWRHSVAAAAAARMLAGRDRRLNPMEVFLAALVHDIGTCALALSAPIEFRAMRASIAAGAPVEAAERAAFGATHGEMGAALLERWSLPAVHRHATARHMAPGDGEEDEIARVVRAADLLAHRLGTGTDGEPEVDPAEEARAFDAARIVPAEVEALVELTAERAQATETALLA